jgi:hypothetical protein
MSSMTVLDVSERQCVEYFCDVDYKCFGWSITCINILI